MSQHYVDDALVLAHEDPIISIGMPIFNAGRYLRPAVLSIMRQTFTQWELIIIDDASTDGALDCIRDLEDPRIKIVESAENRGLAARLNEAVALARGVYFARMDQDDIAYPERLERQLAFLREDPHLDLVSVRCLTISCDNEALGLLPWARTHEELSARPWLGFYLPHPTWMGRTAWFRRYGYLIPEVYLSEDQELLLRSHAGSCFATVPEVLFAYRMRVRKDLRKQARSRRAQLRMQLGYFMRSGQTGYSALSLVAFCARMLMDIFNSLLPKGCQFGPHRKMPIGEIELRRWQEVLGGLESDNCASKRLAES